MNRAPKCGCDNIVQIWMEGNLKDFRAVIKALNQPILTKDIPNLHSLIPRATGEHSISWTKTKTRHRSSMSTHNINKLARFEAPNKDVKWIVRAGYNNIASSFNGKTSKLSVFIWLHRAEVLILYQIEGSDGSIR